MLYKLKGFDLSESLYFLFLLREQKSTWQDEMLTFLSA